MDTVQAPTTTNHRADRLTLLATSLGFAVVQLDVSVVNVAIRPIGVDLGGGVSALQWIVNGYTLAIAALLLTAGALSDRIGAKRVYVAGFAVFTAGSAACALAPDLGVLVAARIVQGVGAAALIPCSLALLSHTFPEPGPRARAVGLWAAGASVTLSAGPLVGGALIAAVGWRAIFLINLPIGIAAIALTARYARQTTTSRQRRLDLPGQLTAIVALGALTGSVIEGSRYGYGTPLILAGFAVAVLAIVAFLVIESRSADPMLPLGLLTAPASGAATLIGLLMNTAGYGLLFVLSLYFQQGRGYSALQTGLAFLPMTVVVMCSNVLAARLVAAFGPRRIIATGIGLIGAGSAALLIVGTDTPYLAVSVQLAAIGFGLGLVVPPMTAVMLGSVETSRSGVASGTLNTARQTGSALGVAVFGSLIAGSLVAGVHHALLVCVAIAIVLVAVTLRRIPTRP